ncbi:SDR family oxidoreductase [Candidatus Pelagibacter sp.]|nr:SDR family oxidoreductase [Candidatus Pelagibacter sp.]
MNIIISGAFGHIGSYLIKNFQKDKNIKKILLIDNFSTQRFSTYLKLDKKKFNLIDQDLREINFNKISGQYDVFIHLAAITNATESFKIKDQLKQNNYGSTKKVVNFCKSKKIKLIFPSSTSVYGKKHKIINSTNNMNNLFAQSPYAECKIIEEEYIRQKLENFVILRLGTIVGVSEGIRFHTAVNKFCYQASLGKFLTIWRKFYKKKRPYLNLIDCNKVIKYLITNSSLNRTTLDVVTKNYTVQEIVKMISKFQNIKKKFVNTEILNQNSYEVISDVLIKKKIIFSKTIEKDIKQTIKILT